VKAVAMPKLPPPPAAPQQLRLGVGVHPAPLALGGDQVDGDQVVHGQAVPAHQVAQPAAQGEAADAGVAHDPGRGGQPEPLGGAVQLAQQDAAGGADGALRRVDPDGPHQRQVDHQPAVDDGVAGHGVAAAPDRDRQVVVAGEADRPDHVVGPGAAGDQYRAAVDGAVPDPAGLLVALLARPQQRAPEAGAQPGLGRPPGRGGPGRDRCGNVGHDEVPCSSGAGGRRPRRGRWHGPAGPGSSSSELVGPRRPGRIGP
jgi:hypothetical protein